MFISREATNEEIMEDDDFVEGPDMGYAETGQDLFDLDDIDRKKHKEKIKRKQKKKREREKKKKQRKNLKSHFAVKKAQVESTPTIVTHTEEETKNFMDDILGGMDDDEDEEMEEVEKNETVEVDSEDEIVPQPKTADDSDEEMEDVNFLKNIKSTKKIETEEKNKAENEPRISRKKKVA